MKSTGGLPRWDDRHKITTNFRVREARVINIVVFCVWEARGIVEFFVFMSERVAFRVRFSGELLSSSTLATA